MCQLLLNNLDYSALDVASSKSFVPLNTSCLYGLIPCAFARFAIAKMQITFATIASTATTPCIVGFTADGCVNLSIVPSAYNTGRTANLL